MDKLKHKEHDFSSKLRQESVIERLKQYIQWHKMLVSSDATPPDFGPMSINLDLTSACNFACPHCVDAGILNTSECLSFHKVKATIDTLHNKGLLSVILLGGGEPTLHKDFENIVTHIKSKGLQLGIVTNGTGLKKVANVAGLLDKEDWLRISIDAATENTFAALHRPKVSITLQEILQRAQQIKKSNPAVTLGYSFVIVWEEFYAGRQKICPNIYEMHNAVRLACEHSFNYVSFKPCLLRLQNSKRETLLNGVDTEKEQRIINGIKEHLEKAEQSISRENFKILTSVNLRALLNNELHKLKKQPKTCHMQFFNTVVTPSGIFHCPAFRGVEAAKISGHNGYANAEEFRQTLLNTAASIRNFDARTECNVVGCFYHHVNWWIDDFIHSGKDAGAIEKVEDDNFFL